MEKLKKSLTIAAKTARMVLSERKEKEMFVTVCGWIFCIAVLVGLVILATEVISQNSSTNYHVPCDPKKNNGVCSRCARGTWYGYHLKTTTNQRGIIWKKLFVNCVVFMLPLIWTCIVLIFAVQ